MHRKSINHIIETGNNSDMRELKDIFIDLIDYLKIYDADKYKQEEYELYKLAYGKHIDEELAKRWVSEMENKDGTVGQHWSMEETTKHANGYDRNDFYVVMNMMYSDFYNSSFDTNNYIAMAKDWLSDKDVGNCKLLKYYFFVVLEANK